ncbi:MAG: tripartite tricarboxylate transporter substrate binding protein [Betaproteobacteria bacterium]|nr:tripartite tricarboxylate transporter substrate binding protein [Betaproteobacteria bacterium]
MSGTALAQQCGSKAVRLVVPFPPGGGADSLARLLAPRWGEATGQQIVIDNRSGAAGNIGTAIVARATSDGCTLLLGHSSALVVNPSLYTDITFDPEKDFAPITLIGSAQYLLVVHPSVRATSVEDLVSRAKSSPFLYSSAGVGSPNHLAAEVFRTMAGIDLVHVPYKGGGPATLAILSGEVQLLFGSFASSLPQAASGKLVALAVTGPNRSSQAPDIPTMREAGYPGFDVRAWMGVLAPAGTPRNTVDRIYDTLTKVLATPRIRDGLKKEGLDTSSVTPAEFLAYIKAQRVFWAKVIKEAAIKPD